MQPDAAARGAARFAALVDAVNKLIGEHLERLSRSGDDVTPRSAAGPPR